MSDPSEVLITVIAGTALILLLAAFIVMFLLIYQRRKLVHLREQESLKDRYNRELLRVQLEVQEQTHQQISRDIHDNVGQVLAVVRLYLAGLTDQVENESGKKRLNETDELVGQAINDLRNLAHSLSSELILANGLAGALRMEVSRISDSGKLETSFIFMGQECSVDHEINLILFRMCQELLSNVIRHAEAQSLNMEMIAQGDEIQLSIADNGKGFSIGHPGGTGLYNLYRRAELIGAKLDLDSSPGAGTTARIYWKKLV